MGVSVGEIVGVGVGVAVGDGTVSDCVLTKMSS